VRRISATVASSSVNVTFTILIPYYHTAPVSDLCPARVPL
jgi:hypothetical protein